MSKSIFYSKRIEAFQLILVSAGAALIGSALLRIAHANAASFALLTASWIWSIPNCYFAANVFASRIRLMPQQLLRNFYRAEIVKLVLQVLSLVLVAKYFTISVPLLLLSYCLLQCLFIMAPFFLDRAKRLVQ